MSTKIPDELKADMPQTTWGRVLVATPVVMTVVATLLAGLASSEMTRAQYNRSLAAQQQSKAGDQWSFFQAKRLRGTMQLGTLDLLKTTASVRPLEDAGLKRFGELEAAVSAALLKGDLPPVPSPTASDASLKSALEAIERMKPEHEIRSLLASVNAVTVDEAIQAARDRAAAFDAATTPISRGVDRLEKTIAASGPPELVRDVTAARLRYTAGRYEIEARLNQAVANLYELQVRMSNMAAERHHRRSERFFLGMLAAQAAVVTATFALATRQRSILWGLAAGVGAVAVAFAVYVYLWL
jgi:ribosomal protein L12E/L44/L45/RPP1/RPP2